MAVMSEVHRRVAAEMKDRQHRAVMRAMEELVGKPGGDERHELGFAVADRAGDDEVGIIESGAIGVQQRAATEAFNVLDLFSWRAMFSP